MKHLNNQPLPLFHLVIPCYEESKRLPSYLSELASLLKTKEYRTHILVVDDGSSEAERKKLRDTLHEMRKNNDFIVEPLFLECNRGKGFAVRSGWSAGGSASWLAFADADGATPAQEVVRVFDMIIAHNDSSRCFFGSRIRMLGRSVERHWKRHVTGRIYATLVGFVINESIYDSQCGFKVVPAEAFKMICSILKEDRFAFDSELIAALSDAGYQLEEIPVDWQDIPGSKVSLLKDSARMVKSLFYIRKRRKKWMLSNRDS
ncbi:MAG: glycosyltransferase [Deltaproteobacteria bacterium]|nr:glycosyltransferase [Deltaproteobacteria bacterium]